MTIRHEGHAEGRVGIQARQAVNDTTHLLKRLLEARQAHRDEFAVNRTEQGAAVIRGAHRGGFDDGAELALAREVKNSHGVVMGYRRVDKALEVTAHGGQVAIHAAAHIDGNQAMDTRRHGNTRQDGDGHTGQPQSRITDTSGGSVHCGKPLFERVVIF